MQARSLASIIMGPLGDHQFERLPIQLERKPASSLLVFSPKSIAARQQMSALSSSVRLGLRRINLRLEGARC